MAYLESFTCSRDGCTAKKGEVNHWWLGFTHSDGIEVIEWNDDKARYSDVKHLCGLECAGKWVQQQLHNITETNKETENNNGD